MLNAILWGVIQGLTEFLPISSSGHLVLIPALLGRDGPDLATSAMLHLGTLVAVLVYFRKDLVEMARFDRAGRRMITIIVIGTIPAVILGLAFESTLDELTERPSVVAAMLIVGSGTLLTAALVFLLSLRVRRRELETLFKIGGARSRIAAVLCTEVVVVLALGVALAAGLTELTRRLGAEVIQRLILS